MVLIFSWLAWVVFDLEYWRIALVFGCEVLERLPFRLTLSTVVKMPCLCAPTTHAGSFRCRLHRSNSRSQRSISIRPTSGEDLEISTASLIENFLSTREQKPNTKPVNSYPSPLRTSNARSSVKGGSRLRHMVSSSDEEDEVIKPSVPVSEHMSTGTGGSYSPAPGGRVALFRMMKTGQLASKIYA